VHCKVVLFYYAVNFAKIKAAEKKGFIMKNNRRYNCRLQLWIALILTVFRKTELILSSEKLLFLLINEKKA